MSPSFIRPDEVYRMTLKDSLEDKVRIREDKLKVIIRELLDKNRKLELKIFKLEDNLEKLKSEKKQRR